MLLRLAKGEKQQLHDQQDLRFGFTPGNKKKNLHRIKFTEDRLKEA